MELEAHSGQGLLGKQGAAMPTYRIQCSEIWGGIRDEDLEASSSGVVASLYSSAAEGGKGGDIYYISVCSEDLLTRVAVADVMGHGQAVSDVSAWLYELLRSRINEVESNVLLSQLNSLVGQRGHAAMTTAAILDFYRSHSNLYFSYAGHPPLLAYRSSEKRWEAVSLPARGSAANLPLGAFPGTAYERGARSVAAGDRFFVYTDGVLEVPGSQGQEFGRERLLAVLQEAAGGSVRDLKTAVREALHKHSGGSLHHDDLTFVVLEVR